MGLTNSSYIQLLSYRSNSKLLHSMVVLLFLALFVCVLTNPVPDPDDVHIHLHGLGKLGDAANDGENGEDYFNMGQMNMRGSNVWLSDNSKNRNQNQQQWQAYPWGRPWWR